MKIKRQVSNIWYMTKYFWRFGKKYLFFIFIGAAFQALQLYTEVNIIALIINALIENSFNRALYIWRVLTMGSHGMRSAR